jgi:hypothetical protein
MNVIRLAGGLGNQVFQYAFGRSMMQNGIEVKFNHRWFDKRTNINRPYVLDKFKVEINRSHIEGKVIHEGNSCDVSLLKKDGYTFAGYWQYYPYYKDIVPILRQEICVKEKFYTEKFLRLKEEIMDSNSVSLHVRRGDYVYQKGFHDLPVNYYLRALSSIKGDVYIFSDDIPWCRERFKEELLGRKITFVDMEDYLSFELMKFCHNNITANSTFSYWAALLNDNPDKIVISPNKWLGDNIVDDENRFPKEWVKIFDYAI